MFLLCSESQVAVATTLTTTTDEARARFNPIERGCYFEGELNLKYLPNNTYRSVNIPTQSQRPLDSRMIKIMNGEVFVAISRSVTRCWVTFYIRAVPPNTAGPIAITPITVGHFVFSNV